MSFPGIKTDKMSQAALSTPLAHGQLPAILMPPSTTSTFGLGVYETASRLSGLSQTSCWACSGKNDVIQPKQTANVPHHPVLPQARPSSKPDFRKLRRTIFVTAETRRLHEAEDGRVAQGIHRLGGHPLGLFRRKRP